MYGIGLFWFKMLFCFFIEWFGIMVSILGFNMIYNSIIVNLKLFSKIGKFNNLSVESFYKYWKNNKDRLILEKV